MITSPRCLSVLFMSFVVVLFCWRQAAGAESHNGDGGTEGNSRAADADAKALRKRTFDEMRRRAESTEIVCIRGEKKTAATIVADPVQRYSDQTRRIFDGSLWVFGSQGRPAAVLKVCCYHGRPGFRRYEYCLASLCDDLIEVRWPGERGWSATRPGSDLHEIPGGPKPAATEAGRLLQAKEAFQRISALVIDYVDVREEVRRLPRPLYRYRDPDSGLHDGAMFAFGSNGTNPDLLLLVELRGPDLARATWHFMPVRLTCSEIHVRLDGKDVWRVPNSWRPGRNEYATWLFFFPTRDNPDNMIDPAIRETISQGVSR